jgi:molybdopterin converting factor small subunit
MITLLVPGVLRGEVDGASRLSVEPGASRTLGAVLAEVSERWPRLHRRLCDDQGELRRYVNVYVDGEDCRQLAGLATAIDDGAEIQVIPSVAGGSSPPVVVD